MQKQQNKKSRIILLDWEFYFNACCFVFCFFFYNSCNYRKTEEKPSLCSFVNKKQNRTKPPKKKSRLRWDTSNTHSYCISLFFFFCIQEFIKIQQTGQTSKLQLVSSAKMKPRWQVLPSPVLKGQWEWRRSKWNKPAFWTDGSLTVWPWGGFWGNVAPQIHKRFQQTQVGRPKKTWVTLFNKFVNQQ